MSGVYSNTEIRQGIKDKHIVVYPYNPRHVNTSSIDVTLGEWYYNANSASHRMSVYDPYDEESVKEHFGEPRQAEPLGEIRARLRSMGDSASKLVAMLDDDHPAILLQPGRRILGHTHEFIGIKPPGTSSMQARSSTGRNGVVVCMCAGWGDSGFVNRWTMEIGNVNLVPTILPIGMRIAQIVLYHTGAVEGEYATDTGSYQQHAANNFDEIVRAWRPWHMLPRSYKEVIQQPEPINELWRPMAADDSTNG
jgi:dCTP deaminase